MSNIINFRQAASSLENRASSIVQLKKGDSAVIGGNSKVIEIPFEYAGLSRGELIARLIEKDQDVEELKDKISVAIEQLEDMKTLATKDNLTGLYNREGLADLLGKYFSATGRKQKVFSVAMIDLDKFKDINDTYGHQKGDEALKLFAEVAKRSVRGNDSVFRWGGEEFVILYDGNLHESYLATQRLLKEFEKASVSLGFDKTLTFSAGVTQYKNGDDIDSLLDKADKATYDAKENGRNHVRIGLEKDKIITYDEFQER